MTARPRSRLPLMHHPTTTNERPARPPLRGRGGRTDTGDQVHVGGRDPGPGVAAPEPSRAGGQGRPTRRLVVQPSDAAREVVHVTGCEQLDPTVREGPADRGRVGGPRARADDRRDRGVRSADDPRWGQRRPAADRRLRRDLGAERSYPRSRTAWRSTPRRPWRVSRSVATGLPASAQGFQPRSVWWRRPGAGRRCERITRQPTQAAVSTWNLPLGSSAMAGQ